MNGFVALVTSLLTVLFIICSLTAVSAQDIKFNYVV